MLSRRQISPLAALIALAALPLVALAAKPTAKEALALVPVQKDLDYDVLEAKEIEKCTVGSVLPSGARAMPTG